VLADAQKPMELFIVERAVAVDVERGEELVDLALVVATP
jgi:hypothetical protein